MPLIWGVEVHLHSLLTFAVDEGDLSAACPPAFSHGHSTTGTLKFDGFVDARTGLDALD
jgi:hypothetical protein